MFQYSTSPRPKLLVLSIAAALAGASLSVQAAPSITLSAFANPGSPTPETPTQTELVTPGTQDFFATPGTAGPPAGSLFFHTYGYAGGLNYFGARVSGDGTFYGKTSASYTDTYVNTSGSAQIVNFSFHVDSGNIGVAGGGSGSADLLLRLRFTTAADGTEVVGQSHGRIDDPAVGATSCDANVGGANVGALGGYLACAGTDNANGAPGTYSLVKLVAAGDSLTVNYDIISEISGAYVSGGTSYCSGYGGELAGHEVPGGGDNADNGPPAFSGCTFYQAIARSGDPAGFDPFNPGTPAVFRFSVPEPGSLALAVVGLGGLAAARRKRRDKQASAA